MFSGRPEGHNKNLAIARRQVLQDWIHPMHNTLLM